MFRKLFFRMGGCSSVFCGWVLSVWLCSGVVCAAAPEIEKLSLHGVRSGATTTLTIHGRELLSDSTVLLSVPVAFQFVRKESNDTRLHLDLRLDESTPSGFYQLRVANSQGVSNAVFVGIDRLPQISMSETLDTLPVAMSGVLSTTQTVRSSFMGNAGDQVVVEVEAKRIGSSLDPVIELLDPRGILVAWSQGMRSLSGDARVVATLPVEGSYQVVLRDVNYAAKEASPFRLKIGDFHFADLVFPLQVQQGRQVTAELIGRFSNTGQTITQSGTILGEVPVVQKGGLDRMSGSVPRLRVGIHPEVIEHRANDKGLPIQIPVVINGRIEKESEEDRFVLAVEPGQQLRFDVLSQRAGTQLDGVLILEDEEGKELAQNDDRGRIADPGLDFTIPEKMVSLTVVLKDLHGRGRSDFIYRIAVNLKDQPQFDLNVTDSRHHVPLGGAALVRVRVNRQGFSGPIELSVSGLPEGIAVTGSEIPASASETLLSLQGFGVHTTQGIMSITGEARVGEWMLQRRALLPSSEATQSAPWLRSELAVALTGPGKMAVGWLEKDTDLVLGQKHHSRIQVSRAAGLRGKIRLSLESSQSIPAKSAAVVPPGQPPQTGQPDIDRAIRIEGESTLGVDQTNLDVSIQVPGDLENIPYDLAIRGELLGEDDKTVIASAVTSARRFLVRHPFALTEIESRKVTAKAGEGTTGIIRGRIKRQGENDHPLTLVLQGLPPGLPTPVTFIEQGKNEFEFPVFFPYGTMEGSLSNVELKALDETVSPEIQSPGVPLAIDVVEGELPQIPGSLFRIFEDERYFMGFLHEGSGTITLDRKDAYSGNASLRVTGVQRFRSEIPNWKYRIAENPGPGEFRYFRFAWKKKGGENVMLQLTANGQFGPARGLDGPSFRYEVGSGRNALNVKAISLGQELAKDWMVVTRDLFEDFGEFVLTGLSFTAGPGEYAAFDHLYLGRTKADLDASPSPRQTVSE
ncbi:MAG: hypothetical protein VX435_12060 [Planctomycetota bacterium]|nr:hypothetical protein [Planctomycetota bacterium]